MTEGHYCHVAGEVGGRGTVPAEPWAVLSADLPKYEPVPAWEDVRSDLSIRLVNQPTPSSRQLYRQSGARTQPQYQQIGWVYEDDGNRPPLARAWHFTKDEPVHWPKRQRVFVRVPAPSEEDK